MRIVTDCAADMPAAELQALGVTQAPLFIQFPDGEVNSADLSADEFYAHLEAIYPAIPTTSQPSAGIFAEIYRTLGEGDPHILSIHISSGLSGTVSSAQVAAEQVAGSVDVTVWDTLTLAGGQRFQVLAAALAAQAGWPMAAIKQRLAEIRAQAEVLYTLETLEYLARGGRIGRVQALAGALLNIKPVIGVAHSDGKYSTLARVRTLPRGLAAIAEYLCGVFADTPLWLTVQHGQFAAQADALMSELGARLNLARHDVLRVAPVLGVHTGGGIVGASAVPMRLLEDLCSLQEA